MMGMKDVVPTKQKMILPLTLMKKNIFFIKKINKQLHSPLVLLQPTKKEAALAFYQQYFYVLPSKFSFHCFLRTIWS